MCLPLMESSCPDGAFGGRAAGAGGLGHALNVAEGGAGAGSDGDQHGNLLTEDGLGFLDGGVGLIGDAGR
jgi:hypothetical protein